MGTGAFANETTVPSSASDLGSAPDRASAPGPAARDAAPADAAGLADTAPRSSAHDRDPWTPPQGRDLLAGIAVLAVLFAILIVYTQDVPAAPRSGAVAPFNVRPPDPLAHAPRAASALPDWADVPLATTVADLGPAVARAVEGKLAVARPKIARCLGAADRPRPAGGTRAEVVLRLAARGGAFNVEGIEPREPGPPADVLDCARRVLDGDGIPASQIVPGRRYRIVVALE